MVSVYHYPQGFQVDLGEKTAHGHSRMLSIYPDGMSGTKIPDWQHGYYGYILNIRGAKELVVN